MLLAWAVAPLLCVVISAGLGWLLQSLAGIRLGVLALPFGFATAIVAMPALLQIGLSADLATVLVVLAALAGISLRAARPRADERALGDLLRSPGAAMLWPLAAAAAVYVLLMLPLVLSGRIGVLGYFFLNDPAWHTALVEWLHQHGNVAAVGQTSSYESVSQQVALGYPLGTYAWPLIAVGLTGQAAFALWTPISALALVMLAIVFFAFARSAGATKRWAALGAVVVAIGYLPLNYFAQGGSKELLFAFATVLAAWCLAGFVSGGDGKQRWRATLPAAVALAATVYVFGPGSILWIGPLAALGAAWALYAPPQGTTRKDVLLTLVAWALTALVLLIPAMIKLLDLFSTVEGVADSGDIGNLRGPVPILETLNMWISHDYRLSKPLSQATAWTLLVSVVATTLAAIGVLREGSARRMFVPFAAVTGVIAIAIISLRFNDYFVAKAYVAFAPVAGCATFSGLVWLFERGPSWRRAGYAVTAAFLATFILAGGIGYGRAYITPDQRFEELAAINERAAGKGPMLIAEREEYSVGLLRDAGAWSSFALPSPARMLRGDGGPSLTLPPDVDGFHNDHFDDVNLVLTRNGPSGSRPPAAFDFWFSTPHYTVWRRSVGGLARHIPVGLQTPLGEGKLDCEAPEPAQAIADAERTKQTIVVSRRQNPATIVPIADFSGDWRGEEPDQYGFLVRRQGSTLTYETDSLQPGKQYTFALQGTIGGAGMRVSVNGGEPFTLTREQASRENWSPTVTFTAERTNSVKIEPNGLWFSKPGGYHADLLYAAAFVPVDSGWTLTRTDAAGLKKFCGETIDWFEVLPEEQAERQRK